MFATTVTRMLRMTKALIALAVLAATGAVWAQAIPPTTVGVSYNFQVPTPPPACNGFTPAFNWDVPGAVPGVNLGPTGLIAGTPTVAGPYSLTGSYFFPLAVSPPCVGLFGFALSWTINPAPQLLTASLPNGVVGLPYNPPWSTSGGTGSLNFLVSAGALPPGLALSVTGAPVGTPTTRGHVQLLDSGD